jgi:hypothetical protein
MGDGAKLLACLESEGVNPLFTDMPDSFAPA